MTGMEEKSTPKLFRTLQILIPLASVAVGITGVLLTVAARKKEITCTLTNSTRLVSENLGGIHPEMRVEFNGQPIFSLTKMTFALRNTGAAAIMAKDVVDPVRLAFPPSTKLMSASVERTFPPDLSFSAHATEGGDDVTLEFPLLNRGDEALFSVYILNSDAQRPKLEGRVVDVPQLVYTEANISDPGRSVWPFRSHATRAVVRWFLVSLYCTLTLLFLGILIGVLVDFLKYLPWKYKWKHLYDECVEQHRNAKSEREKIPDEVHGQVAIEKDIEHILIPGEPREAVVLREHFLVVDHALEEALKSKGIPPHPHPMTETIGGLAGFAALMLSMSSVCSTTAFIVYRAMSG